MVNLYSGHVIAINQLIWRIQQSATLIWRETHSVKCLRESLDLETWRTILVVWHLSWILNCSIKYFFEITGTFKEDIIFSKCYTNEIDTLKTWRLCSQYDYVGWVSLIGLASSLKVMKWVWLASFDTKKA